MKAPSFVWVAALCLALAAPLGAGPRAPAPMTAAEEPRVAVTVHGSNAAEAFELLQGKGIFVIPLGTLSTHSFLVPAELRFRPVPANELLAGIAALHGLEVRWWRSVVTVAVLQRGSPKDQVDAAIADLDAASAQVRMDAAWRAGWLEDAAVLPPLVSRTTDSDRWVSRQAMHAVVRLGWPAAIFLAPRETLPLLDPKREAGMGFSPLTWRMIAETFGGDALPILKTACARWIPGAAAAVGRVPGGDAVAVLESALATKDAPELQRQAIIGLGLNGGKQAVALLERSLTGSFSGDALVALARASRQSALPAVKTALKQAKPDAYAALGQIGGAAALPLCAPGLTDKSAAVRRAAVDAAGMIGGPGAPALLAQALADVDADVRVNAARALGRIGGTEAFSVLKAAEGQATREVWEQIVISLGEMGSPEAEALLLSLTANPRFAGGAPAIGLGRTATDRAVQRLRGMFPDLNAAPSAAEALGGIGDSRALAALTEGIASADPSVRLTVTTAAGRVGGQRSLPLLTLAAKGADSQIVRTAVSGLQQCGGQGAVALLDSLCSSWEPGVRRAAAQSLGAIGGLSALRAVTPLLTDSERLVRQEALSAVIAVDLPQSVAPVGKAFADEALRSQATSALGKLGGPEASAILDKLLETDPRLAIIAANSFERAEAAPFWIKALRHRDPSVRDLANNSARGYPTAAGIAASQDPHARIIGIPLLFPYADMPFAQDQIIGLLFDTDAEVRRQAALTLGQTKEPGRTQILSLAAARDLQSSIKAVRLSGSEEMAALMAQVCHVADPAGLIRAVEKHDTAGVQALLARGANVHTRYNAPDRSKGKTILMEAAFRGYADLVSLLIKNGAAVEAADGQGMTALAYAILSDKGAEPARILLQEAGADLRPPVYDSKGTGRQVLFAAVGLGRLEVSRLLIGRGADVNAKDWDGFTPLMIAARGGRADIAGLLLDEGARMEDRSKAGETALILAAAVGSTDVVKLLLDRGADAAAVDGQGKGVLVRAVESGSSQLIDLLASRAGASGSAVLAGALQAAGLAGKADTIETLLAGGVEPEWDGMDRADSMVRAAAAGRLDVIIALQKKGTRLEATDAVAATPLAAAAEKGRLETARYLIQKGARVNAGDIRGWTPLMRAAAAGQAQVITLLLQAGANPYAVDRGGSTAFDLAQGQQAREALTAWRGTLIEAIRRGDLETVKRIATAENVNVREPSWRTPGWPGVDVPGSLPNGMETSRTPLMFAAETDNGEIARVLLQKGARITDTYERNPETSGQYTADALSLAVMHGSAVIVGLLLDKGAKATDDLLLNACMNGHLEVVKLLAARGASVKVTRARTSSGDDEEGTPWSGDAVSAAIESRNQALVDFLRQKGAPLTAYALSAAIRTESPEQAARFLAAGSGADSFALVQACFQGYTDLVRDILRRGVDADGTGPNGYTPLEAAVVAGKVEVVRLLLEHGATVGKKDSHGRTVLDILEQQGGDQIYAIRKLLEQTGKEPGAYQLSSELTHAVLNRDTAEVKKLLARKPDPGTLNMAEEEPLAKLLNNAPPLVDVACVLESKEIVRLLVQRGAVVSGWSKGLRYAAEAGRADIVELLLSAPEAQKGDAQTRLDMALIRASENGNPELVSALLAKGANPNAQLDRTPLMNAAESGSLATAKALLARGANVNTLSSWRYAGTSALSLAMGGGRRDMVKLLLSSGADGSGSLDDGTTPLATFLRSRDLDSVSALLKNGANVSVKDASGEGPLHIAVSQGNLELVQAITARGADVELRDRTGRNPLMRSLSLPAHQEISLYLLGRGVKVVNANPAKPAEPTVIDAFMAYGSWNEEIVKSLEAAYNAGPLKDASRDRTERFCLSLMKRDLAAAGTLLAQGAQVDQVLFDDRTPLMGAAAHGDLDVMRFLLGKGADPAREGAGGNALDAAVSGGHADAAALLLPLQPQTPDPRERMLRGAAHAGNAALVQALLDQGVNPDATGRTGLAPLFFAASGGHADVAGMLLKRNVMVNRTGSSGYTDTPVTAAAQGGHRDVVDLLVSHGGKVSWLNALTAAAREVRPVIMAAFVAHARAEEKKGEVGRGFLVMAVLGGDRESVKLLLSAGITPDARDWGGHTALGAAVGPHWYDGRPDIAVMLVESGAPVDSRSFAGPALWVAASKGYTEVVKALLARGADVNALGEDGTTASQAAAAGDHALIAKMLLAKGARSAISPPELQYLFEVLK
jgi:ankyrin repeat protein/HEAT repeat protein